MSNFFNVLNQDVQFEIDLKALETQFIEAQKLAHPDNFSVSSLEQIKKAQEKSALINQAYYTLKDPFKRAIYFLSLKGFSLDENAPLSPEFLMEQMEIRERLEEADTAELKEAVYRDIQLEIARHYQRLYTLLKGDKADVKENLALANTVVKELRFWITL